jgi:hypothetical protein
MITYVSVKSILADLENITAKYGMKFVLTLFALMIFEYNWWQWPEMKEGILNDPDLKKNLKSKDKP